VLQGEAIRSACFENHLSIILELRADVLQGTPGAVDRGEARFSVVPELFVRPPKGHPVLVHRRDDDFPIPANTPRRELQALTVLPHGSEEDLMIAPDPWPGGIIGQALEGGGVPGD